MKSSWSLGLDPEKTKEMEREFTEASLLRKRLIKILEDKIDTTRNSARNKEHYVSASWPYLQADLIGMERAYSEIISLLE